MSASLTITMVTKCHILEPWRYPSFLCLTSDLKGHDFFLLLKVPFLIWAEWITLVIIQVAYLIVQVKALLGMNLSPRKCKDSRICEYDESVINFAVLICTGIIAALFLLTGRVSGKKGQSNQLFHSGFLLLILPRVLGID